MNWENEQVILLLLFGKCPHIRIYQPSVLSEIIQATRQTAILFYQVSSPKYGNKKGTGEDDIKLG